MALIQDDVTPAIKLERINITKVCWNMINYMPGALTAGLQECDTFEFIDGDTGSEDIYIYICL